MRTRFRLRAVVGTLRLLAAGGVLAALAAAAPGFGQDAVGPTDTVRRTLDQASSIAAAGKNRDEQLAGVRALARQLVDTRAIGRRAIGSPFTSWTPAQQEEFLQLFDEMFVRAYLQKLLLFREPKFRFDQEEKRGDAVIVTSELLTRRDAYKVAYEMRRRDDRWLATDIVIEGVSMTSNYSDQFASLLRERSVDDLLELMRRKVEGVRRKDEA